MSEEGEQKKLKDYSNVVDAKIPEYLEPVRKDHSQLQDALQKLLALEKKTRLAADVSSSVKLCNAIIDICHELKDWKALSEHITLLCKRRAQLKKVHETLIQRATEWIKDTPDDKTKREFIDTLRTVSAGKMFVELERARMTRILAEMEEADGKLNEAADVLQEVQVETIGAMKVREKAEILLEQVRLCLAKKDYIRAEIISKKVSTKALEADDMQDLKLKYYNLMITFYKHNGDYLSICKSYKAIYDTKSVQDDPVQWREALKNVIIFLVLSPFDSEVSDLLHRVKLEKKLQELNTPRLVLELFTTDELMAWPLPSEEEWTRDPIFADSEEGKKRYSDLKKRSVQHNIRTIAKYYHRITSARLAELLSLDADATEDFLSELVSSKQLYAKIDRKEGIITFTRKQTANTLLNEWSSDIGSLLGLVEKTCHLINKEYMVKEHQSSSD